MLPTRPLLLSATALACLTASPVAAQVIVQPGKPGEASRTLSGDEAAQIAIAGYVEADADFMQMMIHHHHQATVMSNLAQTNTSNPTVVEAANRILAGQADEVAFMQQWLRDRGLEAPDPAAHAGHAMAGMHNGMAGMATAEQLASLRAARGDDFDRMFLKLMIAHHEGALEMVEQVFQQPGTLRDAQLAEFAGDVYMEQQAEIGRMNVALADYSEDPRVGLEAGYRDAGQAISNLRLVAEMPKPAGFFEPGNPEGLPPVVEGAVDENGLPERNWNARSPLLSFAQTDMAFRDDLLVTGNYHGFSIYRLGEDGVPALVSSVVCPGGQGDVSIVDDLLIMSVEQERGRVDCGQQGVAEDVSAERMRGLRIFDISDLTAPRQVGIVQTCRGSHTHSVVDANDERIIVYNSGTSGVRDGEELARCVNDSDTDPRSALFSIDVIEIPVANPAASRIVDSPRVFADAEGNIAGLWSGGNHGRGTQYTNQTNQCHDITVFPAANIAAGACSGNGILLDISDPMKPTRIDAVTDDGFAYWHSATFNNDGTKVIFTDEWGGGGRPRCQAADPMNWGADAIYDIVDGKLVFRDHYKIPAAQSAQENCVAHNGSSIPVPGRDIFAQAWYQGGLSVMDFTDSDNPEEIAFFDRGPVYPTRLVMGGYWSTYYYDGRIYGTEIARGLDVFALTPSEHLTQNEIDAAALAEFGGTFNPQNQEVVTWPDVPVVAKAYLDQIERMGEMDASQIAALRTALDAGDMDAVRGMIDSVDGEGRRAMLAATLRGIVAAS